MNKLSPDEIRQALKTLDGWTIVDEKLHKEFEFEDFGQVFGFMTKASAYIEEINHHPEWCNVYNRLVVDLTTHDAGGITQNDVDLAMHLNSI